MGNISAVPGGAQLLGLETQRAGEVVVEEGPGAEDPLRRRASRASPGTASAQTSVVGLSV